MSPLPNDLIVTHDTNHGRVKRSLNYRNFIRFMRVEHGLGTPPSPPERDEDYAPTLDARIERGMWLVDCPGCGNALVVDDNDLIFNCTDCGSGDKWHRVRMPGVRKRREIERLLLLRPGFRHNAPNRNWWPHESVEDLRRENLEHGIGV